MRMTATWSRRIVGLVAALMILVGCASNPRPPLTPNADMQTMLAGINKAQFEASHPGWFVDLDTEPGFESVALVNYDPATLPVPSFQEYVGYGRVSVDPTLRDTVIYSLSVQDGDESWSVELDSQSLDVIHEDGTWFLPEARDDYVAKQLDLIDAAIDQAG